MSSTDDVKPYTDEELAAERRRVKADLKKFEHYSEPWPRIMATLTDRDRKLAIAEKALRVAAYMAGEFCACRQHDGTHSLNCPKTVRIQAETALREITPNPQEDA